ncbi:MAG: succinate dehydrogenase [Planctomycetota bacterium]
MRNYLVLKRLHSVVGIIPVGVFLIFHLFANSFAFKGADIYDRHVRDLYEIPILIFLEIFLIWIPILFHAILGLYIIYKGRVNVVQYPYSGNIFFTLQRLSGIIALAFIVYHIITTRFKFNLPESSCFLSMQNELFNVAKIGKDVVTLVPGWKFYFYILGILTSCFHFGNGLWSFCINFGILQGEKIQLVGRVVFLIVGLLVAVLGFLSLAGFYKGV